MQNAYLNSVFTFRLYLCTIQKKKYIVNKPMKRQKIENNNK
jgi:hypothetical protein